MKILIFEPYKYPRKADIPHTLRCMQETVGGDIQAIYPWDDPLALVCDDEALLKDSEFNRFIYPNVFIFGTFFLCGIGEEDFTDLSDKLMEKYAEMLRRPQILVQTPDGITAMQVDAVIEVPDQNA